LEDFVGAKFYCPHALADGNQRIRIREKTLEFSPTVSSTVSPYVYLEEDRNVLDSAITDCSSLARPSRLRSHHVRHSSATPPRCTGPSSDTGIDLHDMLSMQPCTSRTRSSLQSITL